jgi:hypothetical protein
MKIPGKGLLKTVSILFIVFGVIFTLSAIISLFSISKMNSPDFASSLPAGVNPGMFDTKTMLVSALLLLAGSVLDIVFGIFGVIRCGNPDKAHFFFTTGVILCGLSVVSLYIGVITTGFNPTSLVAFVLPALYIIGSFRLGKATANVG